MDPSQDTESLVRLTANSDSSECGREEKEEVSEELAQGKCTEEVRRPMPQHVMEKKPPWMSSLLPTPLLPLPTLNFTVSQVTSQPSETLSCRIIYLIEGPNYHNTKVYVNFLDSQPPFLQISHNPRSSK